jgi:isoleucyl-tRNA synthetase
MATQAYKNKHYGQVYGLTLDFLKSYIMDFYIPTRKSFLTLNSETFLAKQVRSMMNLVLRTVLISIYPILPFNAEFIYSHCPFRSSKSISFEPWPVKSLQKLVFREDLVEKIEFLRKLKLTARKVFQDERLMNSGYSSYKFQLVIKPGMTRNPSIISRTKECLDYISKDFDDVLWDLFECTGVRIEGDTNVDYQGDGPLTLPYRNEFVSFVYKGFKIKVKMEFYVMDKTGECARCLRYTRTDPKEHFCGDCRTRVDHDLEKLYLDFFDVK